MRTTTTDPVIREFATGVRTKLGDKIVAIFWFGSRARGEGTVDSDYDVMLETRNPLGEDDRNLVADTAIDLAAEYGVLFDVHMRTSAAIASGANRSPLISNILQEAVAA